MSYFLMSHALRMFETDTESKHRFGGPPVHKISNLFKKKLNLHCLYLFDQTDPRMPDLLPDRKWLPLYYPLFNNACEFGYEVISDEEIYIHEISEKKPLIDFPYDDFPTVLPERPVDIDVLSYEQQKTLTYAFMVEDLEYLSDSDRTFRKEKGYPFTQIGGIQEMAQDIPEETCPNKKCSVHKFGITLDVFAVVWNNPIKDFTLWGEEMSYSQIIYQICSTCGTIHVCNRC